MPWSYKRKTGRASTPLEDMDRAVKEVENGKSIGQVAKQMNRISLKRYIHEEEKDRWKRNKTYMIQSLRRCRRPLLLYLHCHCLPYLLHIWPSMVRFKPYQHCCYCNVEEDYSDQGKGDEGQRLWRD
ncbi:hypothetical protein MHYP_G00050340 [Metynnis hypsauchen]